MDRSETKVARLLRIEDLLLSHPEGLSQAEIARRLGVNRSTITRYIPDFPSHIYLDDMDGNLWKIDRRAYLVNVRFNLNEALAIHLASRLLVTCLDRQNPNVVSAMHKLGLALERLAPLISNHLKQSALVAESDEQKNDPVYLNALELLTEAWAENRKTHIWHKSEKEQVIHDYKFSPYFIEPNAVGQSTYVIGFREPPNAIRTFKIERIQRVEILRETYEIPKDFDPQNILSDAWGIWFTNGKPEEVVLQFQPRVAHRVGETRWHRSEQVTVQEDGSLLWRVLIAEPREMIPWIRGWGADVEVIKPVWLREEIQAEVIQLMHTYGVKNA